MESTDYLPPVDPTFSDFLRAMVTADFELNRADDSGLRAAIIESFRQRGIRPEAVGSLAVPSLLLPAENVSRTPPDGELADIVRNLLRFGAQQLDRNYSPPPESPQRKRRSPKKLEAPSQWVVQQNVALVGPEDAGGDVLDVVTEEDEPEQILRDVASRLGSWANNTEYLAPDGRPRNNREYLKLHPDLKVAVRGFHPVHRIAPSGELLIEMVAHFVQTWRGTSGEDLGGLKYRAGVTMIVNIDGHVRYLIKKPFIDKRRADLGAWVVAFDELGGSGWPSHERCPNRLTDAFSARAMDRRRWR
jgi:hypothetical protein